MHHDTIHELLHHWVALGPAPSQDPGAWECAGRGHHGGHRGGEGGHGFRHFGFGGPGGFGFRTGRKLSSADLQLLLLHLIGEKPRHGYELIKAIEELSNGFYVPSPGVIYPALTYVEELGETVSELDGTRKRYQLTDAGRAHLKDRAVAVEDLLEQLAWLGRGMDRVREAFAEGGGAPSEGEEGDVPFDDRGRGFRAEMRQLRGAFRALRVALREKRGAPREELARIAEILLRAVEDIRGRRG